MIKEAATLVECELLESVSVEHRFATWDLWTHTECLHCLFQI